MKNFIATSCGKCIITGDHSAVYGYPALVMPLDVFLEVEISQKNKSKCLKKSDDINIDDESSKLIKNNFQVFKIFFDKYKQFSIKELFNLNIKVKSDIPQNSGLGSSAAFSHALFMTLAKYFGINITTKDILELVDKAEIIFGGNPSGIDARTVVFNKMILVKEKSKKQTGGDLNFEVLEKNMLDDFAGKMILINSGRAKEGTKEMLELVAKNYDKNKIFLKQIGKVSQKIIKGDLTTKEFMNQIKKNGDLLIELGVVGKKAQKIIKDIENMGGVAKITGAGGIKEGSGFLFCVFALNEMKDRFLLN